MTHNISVRLTGRAGMAGSRPSIGTRESIVVVTMIVTIAAMDITVFGTDNAKVLRTGAAYLH